MKVQTFPHDVVEELHDGDPAVGVVVQQLGVNSSCEELSEGGETNLFFPLCYSLQSALYQLLTCFSTYN